ncbi:MAG: hypothetical protein ACJ75S_04865 [Solirubrobacterales bacterium]
MLSQNGFRSQVQWNRIAPAFTAFAIFFALLFLSTGQASAAIYWTNGDTIGRVNLDGTNFNPNLFSLPQGPGVDIICGGVAVGASHIYWADPSLGTIGRSNLDGTDPNYAFITGANEPCGVAINESHIYWANSYGMAIGRANIDGTEVNQRFIDTGYNVPCGIAINSSNIFWNRDSLDRADITGENITQPFIPKVEGCGIAINGSHIFWTDLKTRIGRANLDGTEVNSKFITGLDRPCGLAIEGSRIYWTLDEPGLIGRANLDGTDVDRSFIEVPKFPCGIAVDERVFPPSPPPPRTNFSFGHVKHSGRKWFTFLAVNIPESGFLHIDPSPGVAWEIIQGYSNGRVPSGGRKWLRFWPRADAAGSRLRRKVLQRDKAMITISVEYRVYGMTPSTKRKRLSLLWR